MLQLGRWLLQLSRTFGQRFFLQFGLHCATHQIRVILISCVVITSLFYPALSLYSTHSNAFIYPDAIQHDLLDIWSVHSSLRVREDAVSRARCGVGRVVRLERILIQSLDEPALNHQILLSTLNLENHLDKLLSSSSSLSCLKADNGRCLVISPLAFWNHNKEELLADTNILDTLSPSKNVSVAGIPVTPQMVLAGRGSDSGTRFDFANYIALTYFFPESDCFDNPERPSWQQVVKNAAQNAQVDFNLQEPILIALEYEPRLSKRKGWSAISALLYLAYTGFFAYVSWSMRQMNAVHSRVGLTFTALVEIAVSTITSLSVCALVGFKVTMVPWELLPLIIIFVGAENMFNLVDAVTKTSITLSVKQRIAEGLSRAGTSNTLKVVSYNAILGVIAVFAHGSIRQFCAFAVVVLVAHWFLAHTFFIAVLSIDIQRLELEELLRQDSSLAPAPAQAQKSDVTPGKSPTKWQSLVLATRRLLKGRATKNLSLFLLLAITGTLYYATLPSHKVDLPPPLRSALSRHGPTTNGSVPDPAWQLWKTLNPNSAMNLHLRIEAPTILTLGTDDGISDEGQQPKPHRLQTLRFVFWLIKIMVLPIAITTAALWGLLLYLLKDTELLEAQRNKAEPDQAVLQTEDADPLEKEISFSTFPRVLDSDIELIAASKDGKVVIAIGLQNDIAIWHVHDSGTATVMMIDAADVLLRFASSSSASSTLACVAVDDEGRYCAVGTGAGVVAVWEILESGVRPLPHFSLDHSSAGVTDIQFSSTLVMTKKTSLRSSPSSEPTTPTVIPVLFAVYENGLAVKWSLEEHLPPPVSITSSRQSHVLKSAIVRVSSDDRLLIAFSLEDGTLELVDVDRMSELIVHAGNPADTVCKVHACHTVMDGDPRLVVAAATEAGAISIWDGQTGEFILVLDEAYGKVIQLYLSPVQCETCHYCGHLPLDSFALTFSVDHVVRFFKVYLNDEARRCSCNTTQPRKVPSWDTLRRSRSNSISSSVGTPSTRSRAPSEASPFPVSGHGIHSRRASEKETRNSNIVSLSFPSEDYDANHPVGPPDACRVSMSGSSSVWHRTWVMRIAQTTCERGSWSAVDGKVVGIRRKSRTRGKAAVPPLSALSSSQGLSLATLDRWEFWIFDPKSACLQSSSLSALNTIINEKKEEHAPSSPLVPRLPFTRVFPLITSPSRSLAGFGNTLGIFNFLRS